MDWYNNDEDIYYGRYLTMAEIEDKILLLILYIDL